MQSYKFRTQAKPGWNFDVKSTMKVKGHMTRSWVDKRSKCVQQFIIHHSVIRGYIYKEFIWNLNKTIRKERKCEKFPCSILQDIHLGSPQSWSSLYYASSWEHLGVSVAHCHYPAWLQNFLWKNLVTGNVQMLSWLIGVHYFSTAAQ